MTLRMCLNNRLGKAPRLHYDRMVAVGCSLHGLTRGFPAILKHPPGRAQFISSVGALLSCVLLLPGCGKKNPSTHGPPNQVEFAVDIDPVKTRPFHEKLFATGTLLANESVVLKAERAGTVKEILFEEGRPVKAGQLLLLIDDSELRAQLTGAQARLELSRAIETRDRKLFETKMLSAAEYEQSRASLHVNEAELELLNAQLEKTRIIAPFDGIAGLRQVSPGAYLVIGAPVASLQDVASVKLDFTLPERYLPLLNPGQKTTFQVTGRSEAFTATIMAIEPAIDVPTRSLRVRAIAPNPERRLLPGAFAEVQILLDEDPNAILIPPIALVPGLKQQTVFVHNNGVAEERRVEIGLRTADALQILEGLRVGDELITSGILQLRPGMKIHAKPPRTQIASEAQKRLMPREPLAQEGNQPAPVSGGGGR